MASGIFNFASGVVNRAAELEGFNTPQKQMREKNADLLEHAILGIQARTDLSPEEKTFQIGEARKQLQNLYEPHEAPQLFARLGKLFGKKDATAQSIPATATPAGPDQNVLVNYPAGTFGDSSVPNPKLQGKVPGTPSSTPQITLRPGMTIDDVLAAGSKQAAPAKVVSNEPFQQADGNWYLMTQKSDGTFSPQVLPGYQPPNDLDKFRTMWKGATGQEAPSDVLETFVRHKAGIEEKPPKSGYEPDIKDGIFFGVTGPNKEKYSIGDLKSGKGPKEALDLFSAYQTGSAAKDQAQQDKEDRAVARAEKLAQIHADIQQRSKELEDSRKIPAAIAGRVSQAEIIKEQIDDLRTKLKDPDLQQYMGPVVGMAGGVTRKFSKKVQDFYASQESLDSLLSILHGYRGGSQAHQIFHDAMGSLTIDPKAYTGTLDAIDHLTDNVIDEVKSEYPNAPMFKGAAALKDKGSKLSGSKKQKETEFDTQLDQIFGAAKK